MAYKIFTDATADLNDELLQGLPQVEVIPMEIMVDDAVYPFGLNVGITAKEFYQELRNGKFASTSQINPMIYREYFEKSLKQGEDILYLCFTSGLSGTIQSARQSMEELGQEYPEWTLICVDTLCAAVGEGFLVCEALKRQNEGMTIYELAEWIEEHRQNVCHWVSVDTFTHLKHGGRVSAATAAIGTTLNIKPILHVTTEGKLEASGKVRGAKQAAKTLVAKLDEGWMPELGKNIIIGHGDASEQAEEIKNKILEKHPDAKVCIADIGCVIGAHTGPGVQALIYWGNNK